MTLSRSSCDERATTRCDDEPDAIEPYTRLRASTMWAPARWMCQRSTCDEVADETLARYRRVGGVRSADESKVPVIERRRGQRAVDVGSGENVFAREGAIFEAWVTVTSTTKGYVPGVSATRHRWQSLRQGHTFAAGREDPGQPTKGFARWRHRWRRKSIARSGRLKLGESLRGRRRRRRRSGFF